MRYGVVCLVLIFTIGCGGKQLLDAAAQIQEVRTVGNFSGVGSDFKRGQQCIFVAKVDDRDYFFELTNHSLACWPESVRQCALLKGGDRISVQTKGNVYIWKECFRGSQTL